MGHTSFALNLANKYGFGWMDSNLLSDVIEYTKGRDSFNQYAMASYDSSDKYWKIKIEKGKLMLINDNKVDLVYEDEKGNVILLESHDQNALNKIAGSEKNLSEMKDNLTKMQGDIEKLKTAIDNGDKGGIFGFFTNESKLKDLESKLASLKTAIDAKTIEIDKLKKGYEYGNSFGTGKQYKTWDDMYKASKQLYGNELFSSWESSGRWNITESILNIAKGKSILDRIGLEKIPSLSFAGYYKTDIQKMIEEQLKTSNGNYAEAYNQLLKKGKVSETEISKYIQDLRMAKHKLQKKADIMSCIIQWLIFI